MKGGLPLTQSARIRWPVCVLWNWGDFQAPQSQHAHVQACALDQRVGQAWTACTVLREKSRQQKLDRIFTLPSQQAPKPFIWSHVGPDLYLCFHGISVILRPWGLLVATWGYPSSSAGKESACNAGDPSSIPGSGRSAEKGIGYPLQSSWASLMAQLVKNLPTMQETWVISLGWEDPLEKRTATHSSSLAWRIPWTAQSMGRRESDTAEWLSLHWDLIVKILLTCEGTEGLECEHFSKCKLKPS